MELRRKNIEENIQALLSLKTGQGLSAEINKFQGFGGLRDELKNPVLLTRLNKFLNNQEIESLKATTGSAYYTPELITRFMWALIVKMRLKPEKILEPAAGTGAFLESMPDHITTGEIIAIEKDILTSKILRLKYPDIKVISCSFGQFYRPISMIAARKSYKELYEQCSVTLEISSD